jgi:hypothetical protein
MRNRVLAVLVAILAVGAIQAGAMFVAEMMSHNEIYAVLGETISSYVGKDFWSVAPSVAAAGAGAVMAAVMLMLMKLDKADKITLPDEGSELPRTRDRNGKLRRAAGMIEERPIHAAAESRIDRLMKL